MTKQSEKSKNQATATIPFSAAIVMFAANAGLTQSGHFNFWNWVLIVGGLVEIAIGGAMIQKARKSK